MIYPEARYANVGTSTDFPLATAKLCKLLKVPVVTVNMKGNYLKQPIWNLRNRSGVRFEATVTKLMTTDEVTASTPKVIHEKLLEALSFNEYEYQKEANIKIKDSFRAEGLHLPLYQCIHCKSEHTMASKGAELFCKACGQRWYMEENGDLINNAKPITIPYWYNWERKNVEEEVKHNKYILDHDVHIEALPNAKNFIDLGTGHLRHDNNGFVLKLKNYGKDKEDIYTYTPKATFSVHTEYDYRGLGQCITLSTHANTYFLFPLDKNFNATKIQFATEYMHKQACSST